MPSAEESLLLAPNFFLIVRWSARIVDFVEEWQKRQIQAPMKSPLAFTSEAADVVLGGVEQGQHQAQELLATTYRLSGLLPAPGDILLVGPLEMRVDQRHFTTRQLGEVAQAEVVIYLGVERYRYESKMAADERQQLTTSSLFSSELSNSNLSLN
jgi:hypothetical protein